MVIISVADLSHEGQAGLNVLLYEAVNLRFGSQHRVRANLHIEPNPLYTKYHIYSALHFLIGLPQQASESPLSRWGSIVRGLIVILSWTAAISMLPHVSVYV